MFDLSPGQFLDFSFSPSLGCYVFVNDPTKLDSTQFTTSAKINGFMGGTHYFHNAFFPDMDSIRKGIVVMAEAEQWSWTKKQDFRIIQKQFDEFIGVYPFIGQCRFYNSGLVFNMMAAILRRVLPTKQLRDQFKTGYRSEIPLPQYYLLPDMQTANQRMLDKMTETLKRRYENEQSFSLFTSPLYRRRRPGAN
ncbi:expressed unknown protein [Seminavis robusta]|uniref:Uncharacterized protein n=1 Tax=Seminavis robusta TaxID=568900 RepID=A0A9N8HYW6_9STRA|nr:expressed unknown protein [Seminavis robusta]|eukprot:Sro3048_g342830.1 n/a (193) ;mRNA; r:6202-6780